jgi:hypothetical protein
MRMGGGLNWLEILCNVDPLYYRYFQNSSCFGVSLFLPMLNMQKDLKNIKSLKIIECLYLVLFRCVKPTIHLHLMPRSRRRGAILPLPNTLSRRGAQLK